MSQFNFLKSLSAASPFDPSHKLVTSPVISSPFVLAILRFIFAFYTTFALIFSLTWDATKLGTADRYVSSFFASINPSDFPPFSFSNIALPP